MTGATTSRASAARPGWRRRRTPALVCLGLAALAATACGSGGSTAAGSTATTPAASNSPAPASGQTAFPGVVGTAAAVSGSSMEVQNPTNGQVTVTFTTATAISDMVAATATDVTVGNCVAVVGQPSTSGSATGPVTATTVTISTPVNGNCGATAGFGATGGGLGSFSPRPRSSSSPRPSGPGRSFGRANGKVSSLSASGFVVQARTRTAGADTSITVTTTAATKYLKVVTARKSALKVGECITAVGTANSTGAVAARTIRISQPGGSGCVTGFGRGGGFGSSAGGTAGNA
jgi:hypothetical protein